MTTHETIKRFVFLQCAEGKHSDCPGWQSGYVDGLLRSAGEQCSCEHHGQKKEDRPVEKIIVKECSD